MYRIQPTMNPMLEPDNETFPLQLLDPNPPHFLVLPNTSRSTCKENSKLMEVLLR